MSPHTLWKSLAPWPSPRCRGHFPPCNGRLVLGLYKDAARLGGADAAGLGNPHCSAGRLGLLWRPRSRPVVRSGRMATADRRHARRLPGAGRRADWTRRRSAGVAPQWRRSGDRGGRAPRIRRVLCSGGDRRGLGKDPDGRFRGIIGRPGQDRGGPGGCTATPPDDGSIRDESDLWRSHSSPALYPGCEPGALAAVVRGVRRRSPMATPLRPWWCWPGVRSRQASAASAQILAGRRYVSHWPRSPPPKRARAWVAWGWSATRSRSNRPTPSSWARKRKRPSGDWPRRPSGWSRRRPASTAMSPANSALEKIDSTPKQFTPEDLGMMLRLRSAFNPEGRCSPRKMLPTAGACIEPSKAGRRAAL